MSLTDAQIKQVKEKVLFSEFDTPFSRYFDLVGKVTKLSNQVLNATLTDDTETDNGRKNTLSDTLVRELKESSELHFLDAQSSIEVKKVAFENWQQSNDKVKDNIETNAEQAIPQLKDIHTRLRSRIMKIRKIYENVQMVNREFEALSEGRTSLTVSREEWEEELGKDITDELIQKKYLKVDTNSRYSEKSEKFRVYDDFSKGPKEAKRLNVNMKSDIAKLGQELSIYKDKWRKDADIFSNITNILQDELVRRNVEMENDENMEDNEESEESEDDQNQKRYKRQKAFEKDQMTNDSIKYSEEEMDDEQESSEENIDAQIDNEERVDIDIEDNAEEDNYSTKETSLDVESTANDDVDVEMDYEEQQQEPITEEKENDHSSANTNNDTLNNI